MPPRRPGFPSITIRSVKVELNGALRNFSRNVFGKGLGDDVFAAAQQVFREYRQKQPRADVPMDATRAPFVQQEQLVCPACAVPIYMTADGVLVCLKCDRQFGWVPGAALGGHARGSSSYEPDDEPPSRRRGTRFGKVPRSSYKVPHANGTRARYEAPPAPPTEPPEDPLRADCRLLGVAVGELSEEVVKRRRRELAKQHHSDVGGDQRKMAEINAAADRLIDAARRGVRIY